MTDLARRLDAFEYEYDPYGYDDAFNDREEGIAAMMDMITKSPESALEWLQEILEDEDDGTTRETVMELINSISEIGGLK